LLQLPTTALQEPLEMPDVPFLCVEVHEHLGERECSAPCTGTRNTFQTIQGMSQSIGGAKIGEQRWRGSIESLGQSCDIGWYGFLGACIRKNVVNDDQGCIAGGRAAQVRKDLPRVRIRPVMNYVAEKEYRGVMDWLGCEEVMPCACVNTGSDKRHGRELSNAPSKVT
jgi:hypothetical protein